MPDFRRFCRFAAACGLWLSTGSGCVLPSFNATGIELWWSFTEQNDVDGEDVGWTRNCDGVQMERATFAISEGERVDRTGTFAFPCDDGFVPDPESPSSASNAYVELRQGNYDVKLRGTFSTYEAELETEEIGVGKTSIVPHAFEFLIPTTVWSFELENAEQGCDEETFFVLLDSPATTLAFPPLNDDGKVVSAVYRQNLVSDRGLPLGDEQMSVECDAELNREHRVANVDWGAYRLEVIRDNERVCCSDPFIVDDETAEGMVFDVSSFTCVSIDSESDNPC